jgi:HSP20 family protein
VALCECQCAIAAKGQTRWLLRMLNRHAAPAPNNRQAGIAAPAPMSKPLHWRTTMNELRTFDPFAIEPFDDSLRTLMRPWKLDLADAAPRIKVDVTEQNGSFAVKAEIPGVRKEDIDVRVEGNQVTISAEVKSEKEEKKGTRVLRRECQQGYASRTFTLGSALDEGKADAKYENGILNLTLPKKASTADKRVTVK